MVILYWKKIENLRKHFSAAKLQVRGDYHGGKTFWQEPFVEEAKESYTFSHKASFLQTVSGSNV